MLGPPKDLRRDELFLSSLEQRLPATNLYRRLEATLDLACLRDWVGDLYAERGRPSIDPVVFFKLHLIMVLEGIRSERQLMETADLNLAHRWYLGYGFDEPLPDHSSLTRIRQRLGVDTFYRLFERVVDQCQDAGLVWGKELFFDGTKVRANADIDSLTPRFAQAAREHVTALFGRDVVAQPASDDSVSRPAALPEETKRPGEVTPDTAGTLSPQQPEAAGIAPLTRSFSGDAATDQRLAAEHQARWKLLEERRLDPQRPPSGSGGYRRIADLRVSATDPDATPLNKSASGKLGYHDHYVVDGGKARIIVGMLVTPADVQDNQAFLDLLDRARFRFHLHVRRAIADSKYSTGENLRALAERDIRAYMPIVDYQQSSPFFHQKDFTYSADNDTYRCPQGETLRLRGVDTQIRTRKYYASATTCASCPLRTQCTDSPQGRTVNRPFDEDYRERARQLQTTEAYKKALRKRQVWIEPLFGEAKDWHQLRRFRLRGLENVNIQGLLVATGQNLKRLLATNKRGHRPAGAPRAWLPIPTLWPR
jgi:transposase